MKQLDKWNKELERLMTSSFNETSLELHNFYKQALKEMKVEIKQYVENYDTLSFSKRLEVEGQIKVANRIDEILEWLNTETDNSIRKHLTSEIEHGYFGTWYALESSENIQLDFPMLNEAYIKKLVNSPIEGKTFSKRLYKHQSKLGKTVTSELLNATLRGKGYAVVAKNVAEQTEASYKQALRIARTEGGRVQSESKQQAYRAAERSGVDLQKMWMATLDKKTRHSHQELDGQTVDVREEFHFNGYYAKGPRLFGRASLDINCRCTTVAVVNGIKPELRKDGESKGVIDYKSYQEWSEDRLDSLNKDIRNKLTAKQQAVYDKKLKEAPEKSRKLWDKYKRDLSLKDVNEKTGAYYRADDGVYMNIQEDIKGNYYHPSGNVFFHEFGHNIDFVSGGSKNSFATTETILSNGKTLGETVFKEVKDHIKKAPGKAKYERVSALKEMLKADYDKDIASMASISDLFGGSTSNQLHLGIGHGNGYWKPSKYVRTKPAQFRNERLGKEAFAEMYAATFTNKKELDKFVKWLPESYNMFEELVSILIERGGGDG